ncbi:MAG: putative glycosyltransferase [Frankiales bacterium]|nr:putative glycosyltransferase [Frankiales bacterium]
MTLLATSATEGLPVQPVERLRARESRRARLAQGRELPTVSVVIPALNEAKNLPWVLSRLPENVTEVLLVDGDSTDDTVVVARTQRADIRVLRQPAPGKGAALAHGLLSATGDIVVMIDADGSMDPWEIHAFVGALLSGADVAKGSRCLTGGGSHDLSPLRSVGNQALNLAVRLLHRERWSELCYGYAAFWRDAVDELALEEIARPSDDHSTARRPRKHGHGFEIEAVLFVRAARAGLRVTEVASFEHRRRHGVSRLLTFPDGWRVLRAVVQEWHRPGHRATSGGAATAEVLLSVPVQHGGRR